MAAGPTTLRRFPNNPAHPVKTSRRLFGVFTFFIQRYMVNHTSVSRRNLVYYVNIIGRITIARKA
jgi:hypothetical protein